MINKRIKQLLQSQHKQYLQSNKQISSINQIIQKLRKERQNRNYLVFIESEKSYIQNIWLGYFHNVKKQQSINNQQKQKQQKQQQQQQQQQQQEKQQQQKFNQYSHLLILAQHRQSNIINELIKGNLIITNENKPIFYKNNHQNQSKKLQQKKQLLQKQLNQLNLGIRQLNNYIIKQQKQQSNNNNLQQSNNQTKISNDNNNNNNLVLSQKQYLQFIHQQQQLRNKRQQKQLKQQSKIQQQKQREQKQHFIKIKQIQTNKVKQRKIKQEQLRQKRMKQKQMQKRHQQQYKQKQKKLFHKQQQQFINRYNEQTNQSRITQQSHLKQSTFKLHQPYKKSLIDQHQQKYIQHKQKHLQYLKQKQQQIRHLQQSQNIHFHSSHQFQLPKKQYSRNKSQKFQYLKQKQQRILLYQEKIKKQFIPKISIEKQKELINKIKEDQNIKNGQVYKKIIDKQSGEVKIKKIEKGKQKEKGIKYLQSIKQMVKQYKDKRRNNSNINIDDHNNNISSNNKNKQKHQQPKTKPINYLKQLRQNSRSKPHSSFFLPPQNSSFSITKKTSLSFDQKLDKIQKLSTKLLQKTKQQQMMLKYGKFKTSEEILIQKQIIDQNYIDIINMKLDMIEKNKKKSGRYQ